MCLKMVNEVYGYRSPFTWVPRSWKHLRCESYHGFVINMSAHLIALYSCHFTFYFRIGELTAIFHRRVWSQNNAVEETYCILSTMKWSASPWEFVFSAARQKMAEAICRLPCPTPRRAEFMGRKESTAGDNTELRHSNYRLTWEILTVFLSRQQIYHVLPQLETLRWGPSLVVIYRVMCYV